MGKHFKLSLSTIIFIFTSDLNGDEINNPIIGTWIFESMTTTYLSEPVETDIVGTKDGYSEILIFKSDGTFTSQGKSEGKPESTYGSWALNADELVISEANDAKTIAKYSLGNGILTIISNQEETAEYFAANTVIVYKKK